MRPVFITPALVAVSIAAASPIAQSGNVRRSDGVHVPLGERPECRTVVVVICIVCAFLLALAQGYRAGRMAGSKSETKASDMLVFAQGLVSTVYVLAVGVQTAGLGLSTDLQCRGAIWICIVLYGVSKMALYLFLLERVHIVRAPFMDRRRDAIYVIGALSTVCGWAAIMGYEFKDPIADLSRTTGLCRIGVQPQAALAIVAFDTTTKIALTGLFVWQLRPAMKTFPCRSLWYSHSTRTEETLSRLSGRTKMRNDIRIMLGRNIIGSSLLLVIAATNMIIFLTWPSAKMSTACLLMCMSDMTLSMLITNWLTMRSPRDNIDSDRSSFVTPTLPYTGTTDLQRTHSQTAPSERMTRGGNIALQTEGILGAISPVNSKVLGGHTQVNPH